MNIGVERRRMRRARLVMYGCAALTTLNVGWTLARWLGGDGGGVLLDLVVAAAVIAAVVTWLAAVRVINLQAQTTYHHDQIIAARRVVAERYGEGVPEVLRDDPDRDVNGRAWWEPGYIGPVGG